MMRRAKIVTVFLVVLALGVSNLRGAVIEISITAEITGIDDRDGLLEGKISVGHIMTGSYIYDSATPDSQSATEVGDYWHHSSPYGIYLSGGGFSFQTDPDSVNLLVEIVNNHTAGGLYDAYGVVSYANLLLSNGAPVDTIEFYLEDSFADALSSDALPTAAPFLEDWDKHYISLIGKEVGTYYIDAEVTSIELVPEPATVLLLGLGGLALLRKRKA